MGERQVQGKEKIKMLIKKQTIRQTNNPNFQEKVKIGKTPDTEQLSYGIIHILLARRKDNLYLTNVTKISIR
jgi:hypothetical protein